MNRLHSAINWVSVTSEISHFFCCGLPIVFSLVSLLSGVGLIAAMPMGITHWHEAMHQYELPMIMVSGVVIVLGWALHAIAKKLDCRTTGCAHEPCGSKKRKSSRILLIATGLYVLNLAGYLLLHS